MGIGVSFVIKFTVEVSLVLLFLRYTGQFFTQVYGAFDLETICIFLRGEYPGLSGSQSIYILARITCFGTGYTTREKAMLEGVITSATIAVVTSITNMPTLYQKFEQVTIKLAD